MIPDAEVLPLVEELDSESVWSAFDEGMDGELIEAEGVMDWLTSIGAGAATGATAGAVAGPWGALIGALAGGAVGAAQQAAAQPQPRPPVPPSAAATPSRAGSPRPPVAPPSPPSSSPAGGGSAEIIRQIAQLLPVLTQLVSALGSAQRRRGESVEEISIREESPEQWGGSDEGDYVSDDRILAPPLEPSTTGPQSPGSEAEGQSDRPGQGGEGEAAAEQDDQGEVREELGEEAYDDGLRLTIEPDPAGVLGINAGAALPASGWERSGEELSVLEPEWLWE